MIEKHSQPNGLDGEEITAGVTVGGTRLWEHQIRGRSPTGFGRKFCNVCITMWVSFPCRENFLF